MKERPILFSTEMVQAILDGRKTETRRVINPQPDKKVNCVHPWKDGRFELGVDWGEDGEMIDVIKSPYGKEGDLLYVRESFCPDPDDDSEEWDKHGLSYVEWSGCGSKVSELPDSLKTPDHCIYKASWDGSDLKYKPSIHMPKVYSRIWLRVKEIKVERVQDIDGDSSVAEGISLDFHDSYVDELRVRKFQELWDSINKSRGYGWKENPWVWVVKFEVVSTDGRPG